MARVSAIISAYNGASRYLEQAIGSVLAQTFRNTELFVVDDASTDNTARLVLRFPQARYIRRAENGGQATARNDGARLAKGDYLASLDQDDLWESTFLEETLAILRANPDTTVVHSDGYKITERNEIIKYDGALKDMPTITMLLRGGHDVTTSSSIGRILPELSGREGEILLRVIHADFCPSRSRDQIPETTDLILDEGKFVIRESVVLFALAEKDLRAIRSEDCTTYSFNFFLSPSFPLTATSGTFLSRRLGVKATDQPIHHPSVLLQLHAITNGKQSRRFLLKHGLGVPGIHILPICE